MDRTSQAVEIQVGVFLRQVPGHLFTSFLVIAIDSAGTAPSQHLNYEALISHHQASDQTVSIDDAEGNFDSEEDRRAVR
jgi:hypothetical protein